MIHHDNQDRVFRKDGKQNLKNYMSLQEVNTMNTCKLNKLLGLALTGGLSLLGTQAAHAAAGDLISNTATLNYSVGTVSQTGIDASTSFAEDRVINFTVAREGGAVSVVPNSSQQAIPYLVDNTGNGTHGFLLAGVHNLGAIDPFNAAVNDTFTPTTIETYVDANDNGVLDPAEIAAGNSFIASLAPADPAVRVFVVADIPADNRVPNPLVNDEVAVLSLVAQAAVTTPVDNTPANITTSSTGIAADALVADDNGNTSPGGTFTNGTAVVAAGVAATNPDGTDTIETVFNDTATTDPVTGVTLDATNNPDIDQNAQQSAYSSYIIDSAELTVAKTSTVIWDFINLGTTNDPKAIPGGGVGSGTIIRYTITISNAAGAATATLDNIEDVLPLALDTQFGDGTDANTALSGNDNVRVNHSDAAPAVFCEADNGDTNTDGCRNDGGVGGDALVVDLTTVGVTNTLAAGESLTIEFDVELP